MAENEEKSFELYLKVPENVRMRMIDEMEPADRCRMTRCSKQSNNEAKASKNYIQELSVIFERENYIHIRVWFGGRQGYTLFIFERSGKKRLSCYSSDNRLLCQKKLHSSTYLIQHSIEIFTKYMQSYQNSIKELSIFIMSRPANMEEWRNIDFGIKSLKNLEKLVIHGPVDVQRFLSKIHHPLKELCLPGTDNFSIPENFEQICQVDELHWSSVKLDSQQLQRLSAKSFDINIGKLTEKDIFKIIRSWQNGTLGKEIKSYGWLLRNSNFDKQKLFKLLRIVNNTEREIEIKNFTQPGKIARLFHVHDRISFYIPQQFL